jgi:hypothetical protein
MFIVSILDSLQFPIILPADDVTFRAMQIIRESMNCTSFLLLAADKLKEKRPQGEEGVMGIIVNVDIRVALELTLFIPLISNNATHYQEKL